MGRRVSVGRPEDPGLEALNLVNTIIFYKDQLALVRDGAATLDVFTDLERKRLTRVGILVRKKASPRGGPLLTLHWAVEAVMDRLN